MQIKVLIDGEEKLVTELSTSKKSEEVVNLIQKRMADFIQDCVNEIRKEKK